MYVTTIDGNLRGRSRHDLEGVVGWVDSRAQFHMLALPVSPLGVPAPSIEHWLGGWVQRAGGWTPRAAPTSAGNARTPPIPWIVFYRICLLISPTNLCKTCYHSNCLSMRVNLCTFCLEWFTFRFNFNVLNVCKSFSFPSVLRASIIKTSFFNFLLGYTITISFMCF